MKIVETDFVPFSEFELAWRFTQDTHNNLPSSELSKIHPLNKDTSNYLHRLGFSMITQSKYGYSHDKTVFRSIERFSTAGISEDEVVLWLQSKIQIPDESIFLSWSQKIAASTDIKTFLKYWDDFCYPTSDDVFIFPKSQKWLLLYRHSEEFSWGVKHS